MRDLRRGSASRWTSVHPGKKPSLRGAAAGAFLASALILATSSLLAQQPAPQQPQPGGQPPVQPDAPQPGAGAQVHTGTSSGIDADARLQNLLADHQFLRLEAQLDQLPLAQAQFYRGILANRSNDLKKSIELLEPLVDSVTASGNKAQEKLLRKALAEDYLRSGDWAKAAKAYQALDARVLNQLSADEKDEVELPLKLLPLAAANPPMTVEPCEPFSLQVSKDPLGLMDIPVFVDAWPHSWMLDPTAPFNLIARSTAKDVGLKISDETATIHTLTGRPMQVHVAVIPRFTVGGRLTLRDVTVFVYEDADYYFPHTHYQVQGVLGYPALAALNSLTITAYNTVEIQPAVQPLPGEEAPAPVVAAPPTVKAALPGDAPHPAEAVHVEPVVQAQARPIPTPQRIEASNQIPQGSRFFFDGDQMIVALGKTGDERMYALDASGQQTYLTSRYYEEHSSDFNDQKMELFTIPGSLQYPPQPAFIAESVELPVGTNTVHVYYVQVLTQPLGSAFIDDVYGILGVDALDQLKAYTFDYRTMRFSVRPE